jgi:hypothetical protein
LVDDVRAVRGLLLGHACDEGGIGWRIRDGQFDHVERQRHQLSAEFLAPVVQHNLVFRTGDACIAGAVPVHQTEDLGAAGAGWAQADLRGLSSPAAAGAWLRGEDEQVAAVRRCVFFALLVVRILILRVVVLTPHRQQFGDVADAWFIGVRLAVVAQEVPDGRGLPAGVALRV